MDKRPNFRWRENKLILKWKHKTRACILLGKTGKPCPKMCSAKFCCQPHLRRTRCPTRRGPAPAAPCPQPRLESNNINISQSEAAIGSRDLVSANQRRVYSPNLAAAFFLASCSVLPDTQHESSVTSGAGEPCKYFYKVTNIFVTKH